jgi:hypothetical protein
MATVPIIGQLGKREVRSRVKSFAALKDQAEKARAPYDKDVLLNLAFYLDEQYVEWAGDFNSIRRIPPDDKLRYTPRPVANKIMHFVQQEHAMALENDPTFDVLPATDDPIDISIANVSGSYLEYLSQANVGDLGGELSDALLWALVGGESFIKWFYSERLKRPDFLAISPLDLYTDPYARRFPLCRYIIHSQFMDVEQVYELYGKEVKPEEMSRTDKEKAALLREMGQAPIIDGAIVNELWVKQGRRYAKGAYTVWVGKDFMVEPDNFPYKHMQMPFTQVGSIPRPGSQHYTCAVKYLRSGQMELNKYHQQRLMVREAFSNPKWWIPAELELEQMPDDSPRQILTGNSGGGQYKPELIQPTTFPENQDGEWIRQEMQDTVGLHEVSQGQVPGRVEAAKAIESLKEADNSRLAELTRTTKSSLSQGAWQMLMLAKQYITDEVIVQTYSSEGMPEVKRFKTEDLKPGMKVKTLMGTGLGRTRAAQQDHAMQLWQYGIIQDPELMSELLDVPVGRIVPDKAFDIRLARNENLQMAEDKALTPNSWDEHEIHIREHNNYRKTSEYAEKSGEVKKKFEFHVEQHEVLQLQQFAKEAQKMQAAQAAGRVPEQDTQQQGSRPTPQPGPPGPTQQ